MCALDSKRHSRSSSTYNSFRRLVNNGIHLPPPLKMGGGHRRGVSGGAGRTGEDWNPIGGNRRDEASAGYRRRSAAVMTRIADEDMNVGDGYVSSLAGGGRTQMTMDEGPQQPTGGMVGFVVDGPMRTNVNEMMRMGIRRDRERMTSEVGQNSHVAGDVVGDEHDMEIAGGIRLTICILVVDE